MKEIKLRATAKVNFTLDVLGRRPDGYHEVELLMQSIDLYDEITLTEADEGCSIECNAEGVPLDSTNIAVKAAQLIFETYKLDRGIHIRIDKHIPVAAGLAGGSTDAAAVLTGLNQLWGLGLSAGELTELGLRLGADVPFCLLGGTAIARGIGEQLTPLEPLEGIPLVLVKPSFGVSTAEVYKGLQLDRISRRPDIDGVYRRLSLGDFSDSIPGLINVMEQYTITKYPLLDDIKKALLKLGASASLMTGSGPTIFGIFKDKTSAGKAFNIIREVYPQTFLVNTSRCGIEILEGGRQ